MKICELKESMLDRGEVVSSNHPFNSALRVLEAALTTINQAGLEGKRLSDLRVIIVSTPAEPFERTWEIHAKVTHRLAPKTPPNADNL